MSRPHRLLAALVPPPRDQWIRAHAAELVHIEGRRARTKWQLGVVPLFGWALASQLLQQPPLVPRKHTHARNCRRPLVREPDRRRGARWYLPHQHSASEHARPRPRAHCSSNVRAYLPARARCTKAGATHFTCPRRQRTCCRDRARCVLAAGVATNIVATADDPEYGPMTVVLLIGAHGAASLLAFTRPPRNQHPTSSRTS